MNKTLDNKNILTALISLSILVFVGCGSVSKFATEAKALREATKSVTAEVRNSVTSLSDATIRHHFAKRVTRNEFLVQSSSASGSFPDPSDSNDPNASGSDTVEPIIPTNGLEFYSLPKASITDEELLELGKALDRMNRFSKLIAQLAGIEDKKEITTDDLTNLSGLFTQSHTFLTSDAVAHHPTLKAGSLSRLGGWFQQGAELLQKIATLIENRKRNEAIKIGISEGGPLLESMVTDLEAVLSGLRALEKKQLLSHRSYLAEILEEASEYQSLQNEHKKAKNQYQDSEERYIKAQADYDEAKKNYKPNQREYIEAEKKFQLCREAHLKAKEEYQKAKRDYFKAKESAPIILSYSDEFMIKQELMRLSARIGAWKDIRRQDEKNLKRLSDAVKALLKKVK